jgi:hypothetical protein
MERSRSRPRREGWPLFIGLVIVVSLVAIGFMAWVRWSPPVSQGSVVAWLGDDDPISCDPADYGDEESSDCWEVPFVEGAGVGIGFTVRNTAVLPMTIVAVESLEAPFLTPAYLHPERVQDEGGYLFGLDAGRPFEPIEVAPGAEAALQLAGTYLDCETVAASHPPGSALIIDHARMTLRWAFVETNVVVPLSGALSMPGPISCPTR